MEVRKEEVEINFAVFLKKIPFVREVVTNCEAGGAAHSIKKE